MICDTKWALSSLIATLNLSIGSLKDKSLLKCHQVTAFAHVSSIKADVLRNIATESTLVVDELFTMT